ncbi:MAG: Alginate biosynthesis protein AlgA [Deltaproteobacteria bacterium ADurb.Bin058]|jgi:mannose-6-phosphate isomerase|nr:MAG: Alginate biosynthesis protein AlgA [Deltaproteobacteria bacterium ADurb.Bin058]
MSIIVKPRKVDKPWGFELVLAYTDRYVAKLLHINKGQRLSRQYHEIKDETLYVLAGTLIFQLGQGSEMQEFIVPAGQGFRILPGMIHRFIAPDDSDCDLIEASTPELDDVVRLEDVYGREGTSEP